MVFTGIVRTNLINETTMKITNLHTTWQLILSKYQLPRFVRIGSQRISIQTDFSVPLAGNNLRSPMFFLSLIIFLAKYGHRRTVS